MDDDDDDGVEGTAVGVEVVADEELLLLPLLLEPLDNWSWISIT